MGRHHGVAMDGGEGHEVARAADRGASAADGLVAAVRAALLGMGATPAREAIVRRSVLARRPSLLAKACVHDGLTTAGGSPAVTPR